MGSKWPGLTPGPRHRFRVPYRSCRVAFVDFGPVASPGFTEGERNDDMEPVLSGCVSWSEPRNLSGPASPQAEQQ